MQDMIRACKGLKAEEILSCLTLVQLLPTIALAFLLSSKAPDFALSSRFSNLNLVQVITRYAHYNG